MRSQFVPPENRVTGSATSELAGELVAV
jgi:hypothetical protein